MPDDPLFIDQDTHGMVTPMIGLVSTPIDRFVIGCTREPVASTRVAVACREDRSASFEKPAPGWSD